MPDSVDSPIFPLSVGTTPETPVPPAGKPVAEDDAAETATPVITRYFIPSDALFSDQWHLNNTGQLGGTPGIDINVTAVWDDYTGAGIRVGVVDDGVEYTHHDLDANYDPSLQYD
jgi:hypothetical protein